METVSAMLLEENVVGRNGENFIWKYTSEHNADNERTYGNVTSANWFRRTEKEIHNQWGKDVNLLGLSVACDKTHVDRLGGISVHPCYVTILNLDGCIRRTAIGSEIIGSCPILPYSNEEFKPILRDGYGSMDFTEQLHNTSIRTDKDTRKYLRETKEGRKSMYAKLLDTLRSNDIEEDFEDFELLQNLDLQNLEENDMG
jgi:hypothetical protein